MASYSGVLKRYNLGTSSWDNIYPEPAPHNHDTHNDARYLKLSGGTLSNAITVPQINFQNPIENFNPFSSYKIHDAVQTNVLAGKWKKIKVMWDGVENTTTKSALFDLNYEQYSYFCGRDGDSDHVLDIDLVTNGLYGARGMTYASGTVVFSFYSSPFPSGWSARVRNKDGVWTNMTLTKRGASALVGTVPIVTYITNIEITLSTGTGGPYVTSDIMWALCDVAYYGNRISLSQGAYVSAIGGYIGGNLDVDGYLNYAGGTIKSDVYLNDGTSISPELKFKNQSHTVGIDLYNNTQRLRFIDRTNSVERAYLDLSSGIFDAFGQIKENGQRVYSPNNKPTLAELSDDSTHRLITDLERSHWNAIYNWDKNYLDLINKPTLPENLSDLIDDSTHRLVTDSEKATWNGKLDDLPTGLLSHITGGEATYRKWNGAVLKAGIQNYLAGLASETYVNNAVDGLASESYVDGAYDNAVAYAAEVTHTLISTHSSSFTLSITDKDRTHQLTSTLTVTIPTNASVAYPVGTRIDFIQTTSGTVTFAPASGVTLYSEGNKRKINAQYQAATLKKIATDTWVLIGGLKS